MLAADAGSMRCQQNANHRSNKMNTRDGYKQDGEKYRDQVEKYGKEICDKCKFSFIKGSNLRCPYRVDNLSANGYCELFK